MKDNYFTLFSLENQLTIVNPEQFILIIFIIPPSLPLAIKLEQFALAKQFIESSSRISSYKHFFFLISINQSDPSYEPLIISNFSLILRFNKAVILAFYYLYQTSTSKLSLYKQIIPLSNPSKKLLSFIMWII